MNSEQKQNRAAISVVTATYNAAKHLPKLIASLREQTDQDFEWVVADGASDDGTLELLRAVSGIRIVISSQTDFGIYDALNRAIKISSGEYYIVAGADDFFYRDAIANFRKAIAQSRADIVSANVRYGKRLIKIRKGPAWLFGHCAFISSHTLGTAFKKNLHQAYGYYSRKYPIGSDQYFVLSSCKGGAARHVADFVSGELGMEGVSSVDKIGVAVEMFRIQLALGSSFIVQFFLLLLRFLNGALFKRNR